MIRRTKLEERLAHLRHLRAVIPIWLRTLASVTLGAVYVSPAVVRVRRWRNRVLAPPSFPGRVALVAHAYYVDLLDEVVACFDNLPATADLLITVPPGRAEDARQKLAAVSRAQIFEVPNRGRDIAPFMMLLNEGLLAPYDAVLKLHTKRSPHLRDGEIRRQLLYGMLAGSPRRVQKVLNLFRNPGVGLVGWRSSWRKGAIFWMDNRPHVEALAAGMDVPTPAHPSFFEGSMFWIRPAALERLRALNIGLEQFEPEAAQLDGALHHGIERVFTLAVAGAGYTISDLSGRDLFSPM